MTSDVKELTKAAQEQTLKAVYALQTTILDTTSGVVRAFEKAIPTSFAGFELPELNIPGLDKLPTPADALAAGFDMTEKLLASQRSFAEQLFAMAAPKAPAAKKAVK